MFTSIGRTFLKLVKIKSFSNIQLSRKKGLVIGAFESAAGEECTDLSPVGQKLDDQLEGKLRNALNGLPSGIGKLGSVVTVTGVSDEFPQIAVAGLGTKDADFNPIEYLDEGRESARIAAGLGARSLQKMGVQEIAIESFSKTEAASEGANLGVWYYTDKEVETKVELYEDGNSDPDDWIRGLTKAESQNLVRCLCETPPNYMTPNVFAIRARDLLCPYGVQVFARETKWLKGHKFNALLSLGASSVQPPILLELNYCSDMTATQKPYLFVGQGTTFNSGGLCLKDCPDMMRADFASAAIILGVFKAVAAMRVPLNLRAFMPLYENMLSGGAMKPGDALSIKDLTIRTENTNNHSQITMAEVINYAYRKYPPEVLFCIGTLSSNIQKTVGATSAVWARNDYIWDHINYAGAITGDRMWRYPFFQDFEKKITERTDVDINNLGIGRRGEPNLIAAFLSRFIHPEVDFTYIDVTGSSDTANGYVHYLAENLMTGAPTRGLIQLLCHLNYCKEQLRGASKKDYKSEAEN